ncbi:MAG: hypothetical protein IPL03_10285 [Sterolibacteriaceae bacterium]|nr:hypothetical protein [Candidatus Methylophosphatis haderslevensis]
MHFEYLIEDDGGKSDARVGPQNLHNARAEKQKAQFVELGKLLDFRTCWGGVIVSQSHM